MRAPRPGQRYEDKRILKTNLNLSTREHERIRAFSVRSGISMSQLFRDGALRTIDEAERGGAT
jgi:cell envelope opacity-associated protein A